MSTDPLSETDPRRVVLDFYDLAFVKREPAQAAERYLRAGYTQHNPTAPAMRWAPRRPRWVGRRG